MKNLIVKSSRPRWLTSIPVVVTLVAGSVWSAAEKTEFDWEEERRHWAYRALQVSAPETVDFADGWAGNAVDEYVLAKMATRGYKPALEASPEILIRRLTLDLTGLPPDYEQVTEFTESTDRESAYERTVDRLLCSPRFGERLASMWLTVARFGEDQAHQVGNDTKYFYPNAHLYREWVVEAFNSDMPYDWFVRYQLAADFLGEEGKENLVALGFLGLGPKYYNRGRLDVLAEEWEDRVDTVTRGFLGLTVACARCHDHKYDAITTEDYHGLAGVFASTKMENRPLPGARPTRDKDGKEKMDPDQTMHIVKEGEIQNLPVFLRGDVEKKGNEVPRRFLTVLSSGDAVLFKNGSGRLDLAETIIGSSAHLASRVFVNRIWALLIGHPIVGTPSNFGRLGEQPSNAELLDFLAADFMACGWSVKHLVRQIVMSATYRQSAKASDREIAEDPGNRYLARMNRRKASAEIFRDSLLAVTEELDLRGGRSAAISDPNNFRRTLYGRVSRKELDAYLARFDYPDPNVHCAERGSTTTPSQKLFLLNSDFMLARADVLAKEIAGINGSPREQIDAAYRRIFARRPDSRELEIASRFLERHGEPDAVRWVPFTQALLASNEFSYRD